ncbi:MAG TPA: molecular chaperone TorD family protein [Candidatus Methanoperedenaceae archaeon]|nr:molecular chaperone TorD family protein [Candidatus Methanoperedenaceae archaeon]
MKSIREQLIRLSGARSGCYSLLASWLNPPPHIGVQPNPLEAFREACGLPEPLARELAADFGELCACGGEQDEFEYNRLFAGPGHIPVPPYESLYTEGVLMGTGSMEVRDEYLEEGLAVTGRSDLPDHASFELEFMAYLCAGEHSHWESANTGQALRYLQKERVFAKHLSWMPALGSRILSETASRRYSSLARALIAFIRLDSMLVCAVLGTLEEVAWARPALTA